MQKRIIFSFKNTFDFYFFKDLQIALINRTHYGFVVQISNQLNKFFNMMHLYFQSVHKTLNGVGQIFIQFVKSVTHITFSHCELLDFKRQKDTCPFALQRGFI